MILPRCAEHARLFDFRLPDEDLAELDAPGGTGGTGGTGRALEHTWQPG